MVKGNWVKLVEQPDGYVSSQCPLTVGSTYQVIDTMGSCLVVTTDVPGELASIWRGRFVLDVKPRE